MEYLTQDVEPTTTSESSNACREKIASLFINHKEYPLSMETNIIGRNPDICQIVLNEMTVSSKHAIIKLSKTGHFIMDLGSRNKTKLNMTVLERDTPHQIKDEDWVHFGDVFAIFRLNHKDDDDLPMTQCVIPKIHNSILQESSNRSYKEESFIAHSSQEQDDGCFKIPDSKLIKPSKKTSAIGSVSSCEKDNVDWKSPKKSSSLIDSFNFDIHSLETQAPISDKITSMSNTEVQAEEPVLKTIENKQVMVTNAAIFDAETQAFVNEDDELPSSQFTNKKSYNNDTSIVKNNSILGSSCIVPETDEDDDLTDCEDAIENDFNTTKTSKTNETTNYTTQDDIPTQIICNENINQQYSEEMVPSKIRPITTKTPKKIPLDKDLELGFIDIFDKGKSNNNLAMEKKGDDNINDVETQIVEVSADDVPTQILKTNTQINYSMCINNRKKSIMVSPHKDENFYSATQDILNDLCSQREMSTDTDKKQKSQIPSDSSDVDATPKKVKPTSMYLELPDSEEIGSSISLIRKTVVTDNLSDSENEDNNTEENTPILFKSKRIKKNLTDKFDIPSRVITRVRKPTPKFKNNAEVENIMRSNSLFEQQDQMNVEIINENLSRLRTYENRNSDLAKSKLSNESERIETTIIKSKRPKRDTKKNLFSQNQNTEKPSEKRRISNKNKIHSEKNSAKGSRIREKTINEEKEVRKRGRKKKCDVVDSETELPKNSRHKKDTTEKKIPEKEIRRSNRLQEKPQFQPKSILKNTVYNSTLNSSKKLKRQADDSETRLNPKRPRSTVNIPARSSPTHYVVFSNLSNPEIEKKLKSLGAVMVTDVKDCTVMVSPNIKRSAKFLCAVGLGRPIVGIDWVQACANANAIVDPRLYPLKDEEGEKKFDFDLLKTINGPRGFLKGYNVSSTPNTFPEPALIKQIVECSGGRWKENGPNWICVSTLADKSMWPNLKRKGATIVSTAVLLTGALKQQVDIKKHTLF